MSEDDPLVFSVDLTRLRQYRRGVYFLKCRGEVVYVGQSRNMPRRIWEHLGGDKDFDSVDAYRVSEDEDLDEIERGLIEKYTPKYNHARSYGFLAWETIHAKLKAAGVKAAYNGTLKAPVTRAVKAGTVRVDITDGLLRYHVADVCAVFGIGAL